MKYEELLESVSSLAVEISQLHAQIARQQSPVVRHFIATQSHDTVVIERTLDQLLDVACHDEGLELFRRLCRYYWTINPVNTASYIYAYRELWDDEQGDIDKPAIPELAE